MGVQELHAKMDVLDLASPFLRRPRRLLQNHDTLFQHVQITICVLSSALVLLALAYWRDNEVRAEYRAMALVSALLMLIVYRWRGVFRRFDGNSVRRLALSWTLVIAAVIATGFLTKTSEEFSRIVVCGWITLGFAVQLVSHHLSYRAAQKLRVHFGQPIRAIVLGSSRVAEHLVASINNNGWMPDCVIGVVDDSSIPLHTWKRTGVRYLGSFNQVLDIVREHQINRVYLALPISCAQMIERIYKDISEASIDVVWVPDIFGMRLLNHFAARIEWAAADFAVGKSNDVGDTAVLQNDDG